MNSFHSANRLESQPPQVSLGKAVQSSLSGICLISVSWFCHLGWAEVPGCFSAGFGEVWSSICLVVFAHRCVAMASGTVIWAWWWLRQVTRPKKMNLYIAEIVKGLHTSKNCQISKPIFFFRPHVSNICNTSLPPGGQGSATMPAGAEVKGGHKLFVLTESISSPILSSTASITDSEPPHYYHCSLRIYTISSFLQIWHFLLFLDTHSLKCPWTPYSWHKNSGHSPIMCPGCMQIRYTWTCRSWITRKCLRPRAVTNLVEQSD